jgi:hypothetical protein
MFAVSKIKHGVLTKLCLVVIFLNYDWKIKALFLQLMVQGLFIIVINLRTFVRT